MISDEDLHRAADVLDTTFGLDTLWLYGSEAKGKARADSDVDLGGLFRRHPTFLEILEAKVELEEIFRRDVDLVDLDQAFPILGMQVLRYGRLVVDRNPLRRNAFTLRTVSMYEDLKILRRPAEKALFERFLNGRP